MNLVQLHEKLIAAARAHPPSDEVPYAFETRILARLKAAPSLDHCGFWAQALWRAVAPCIAIMVLLGALSVWVPFSNPPATDLSQEFENTLLAAADQESAADSTW
jgi:hypothetical protein